MDIKKRFNDLIRKNFPDVSKEWIKETGELIISSYSEPHRYYHNLNHIEDCMKMFDMVRYNINNMLDIELAIYFHDIVYDPLAKDNEVRSADIAFERISHINENLANRIKDLVLFTEYSKTFNKSHSNMDFIYLRDIDFHTMGTEAYWKNAKDIRKEFSCYTDEEFYQGRIKFLQMILDNGRIFESTYFLGTGYNDRALHYIEQEIEQIQNITS